MLTRLIAAALVGVAGPALAQSMPMNMPGMKMPAHPKAKSTKPVGQKAAHKKAAKTAMHASARKAPAPMRHAGKTAQQTKPIAMPMEHGTMPMSAQPQSGSTMTMRTPSQRAPGGQMAMPMDHQQTGQMDDMPGMGAAPHQMTGALGAYPMQRESSGTAWQPDNSPPMGGPMLMSGGWMLIADGVVNLVADHQSGPRGDDKLFASGMLMGMAQHPLGDGTLHLKAMISPDPLMGPRGYPLLLASGETANGRDRLIDRQHPHDLLMELSGSVSQNIAAKSSAFIYAGLPGEPAFGPPAFMHRESIMDSPEAPISHHWLDSTHISFGVVTAGVALDRVKLEVSRFNAREPDQHRWDIETGPLDSTAVRLSWNPTDTLALQASWGHFKDPEQLEPGIDQQRLSASALYAREIGPGWKLAATLAWGRKTQEHHGDDAYVAEASVKHDAWTFFGRGEMTDNRELVAGRDGPSYRVGKVSAGAVRDFRIAQHLLVGAGALAALNFVPKPLSSLYGGKHPIGAIAFVRLKLD